MSNSDSYAAILLAALLLGFGLAIGFVAGSKPSEPNVPSLPSCFAVTLEDETIYATKIAPNPQYVTGNKIRHITNEYTGQEWWLSDAAIKKITRARCDEACIPEEECE